MRSLNEYVDIIINSVYAGLKAPSNYSLSKDQVKDEFTLMRNRAIAEYLEKKRPFNPEALYQRIPLTLEMEDLGYGIDTDLDYPSAKIPPLLFLHGLKTVRRVSYKDQLQPLKIVFENSHAFSHHDKYTGNKPTVWISNNYARVINPPNNLDALDIFAIAEDPRAVYPFNGFTDDSPYPIPSFLADQISSKMIQDYLRYYVMRNPQPTTGADIPQNPEKQ
jgi:hypothetical protein